MNTPPGEYVYQMWLNDAESFPMHWLTTQEEGDPPTALGADLPEVITVDELLEGLQEPAVGFATFWCPQWGAPTRQAILQKGCFKNF
jgi:hypothetical protein